MHFMNQDEASLASSDKADQVEQRGESRDEAEPDLVSRDEAEPDLASRGEAPSATERVGNSPIDSSPTEDAPESDPAPRRRDYTSAVYGSVLAATVVVSAGDLRSPVALSTLLIVSGIVFWIAHVYAATVAGRHGGWHIGSIREGMKHEWPVAFAAVPPAIAAAICGLLPDISRTDGVWAALIVAIGEQQLWGYAAVRNAKLTGPALTRTILLNVFMGFIIVALKFGVGH
jgi:hypothetical protein